MDLVNGHFQFVEMDVIQNRLQSRLVVCQTLRLSFFHLVVIVLTGFCYQVGFLYRECQITSEMVDEIPTENLASVLG